MANVNRWISGRDSQKNVIPVEVKSGTTVYLGDLMFRDDADNLRNGGNSTADYSAYPLSWMRPADTTLEAKKALVQVRFWGVAMDDKDGDSRSIDRSMPIATSGQFEYELKPGSTVYTGGMVEPTGTTASSNMYDQKVKSTTVTTKALGYIVKRTSYATVCEVMIRPAFARSNIIS